MSVAAEVLRNRKINSKLQQNNENKTKSNSNGKLKKDENDIDSNKEQLNQIISFRIVDSSSYHLTRIVLVRFIGFIYAVAFMIAFNQNRFLIGKNGLKPANKYLKQIQTKIYPKSINESYNDIKLATNLFFKVPTLLWFVNWSNDIDTWLDLFSFTGVLISLIISFTGRANSILMSILWILYHSIVNVGQTWYSFGWESQLLESGFIAIFLVPLFSLKKLNFNSPPSFICIYLYRWLIFRIMLGAGLIKIRGDQCWKDLTCMNYHYETQPNPNPISYYMHQEPEYFHKFEVLVNHFIELVAPFFVLIPYFRKLTIIGGILQIIFQTTIIISGNLSFLNWLTILPALACFDDNFYEFLFNKKENSTLWCLIKHQYLKSIGQIQDYKPTLKKRFRKTIHILLLAIVAYLSFPVITNLLSSSQMMNTSFEPFRLVNTYGAFGSITKKRHEVIFKGTQSTNTSDPNTVWKEYEFKCKPGKIDRRPCLISPYHYRLDWLMWFAAFQSYEYHPWMFSLAAKLLINDKIFIKRMMSDNPFENDDAPKYVKADLYSYRFTSINSNTTKWWSRKYVREYFPIVNYKQLEAYIKDLEWQY